MVGGYTVGIVSAESRADRNALLLEAVTVPVLGAVGVHRALYDWLIDWLMDWFFCLTTLSGDLFKVKAPCALHGIGVNWSSDLLIYSEKRLIVY